MPDLRYGKKWDITDRESYEYALKCLDEQDFCARMSDSYAVELRERAEIREQLKDVQRQAAELGLI